MGILNPVLDILCEEISGTYLPTGLGPSERRAPPRKKKPTGACSWWEGTKSMAKASEWKEERRGEMKQSSKICFSEVSSEKLGLSFVSATNAALLAWCCWK